MICLFAPAIFACLSGLVFGYICSLWEKVSYISLDELKSDSFLHLYCQHCEEKHLAEIWKKYPDKLPIEKSITNLFYNWDQLGRNHADIDILGCLVPYKPDKVVNNKMKSWFYYCVALTYIWHVFHLYH